MVQMLDMARSFAVALDLEDYPTVESLLRSDCVYACRGVTYHGPASIVDSYRSHGDAASRKFDEVRYESVVRQISDSRVVVQFQDDLTHQGMQLIFRCEQILDFDKNGAIIRIEHVDLPGQREALRTFMREAGVAPDEDEPS